ncbi:uncharacterized protein [Penaeus vannamei]|uniref:uncharacterized protein n=1 Tax=Penaeus vannamei TaxID=6689 RepID=UPI00387F5550
MEEWVFIKAFLSKRAFQVKIASSTSSSFPQFEGVPQDSVLSTTLFLLAVNDIVSVLPPGARASLYVDDLIIYASGTSIPDLCQFLQSAITSGIIFDSKLSWRDHILHTKEKAQRRLRILQKLSHISWGSDHKTLLHHHVTLMLSTLDYGCHIYSSASTSLFAHLVTIHHSGFRLSLGAFHSSPVETFMFTLTVPNPPQEVDSQ